MGIRSLGSRKHASIYKRRWLTRQMRPMRASDLGLWPISNDFSRKKK